MKRLNDWLEERIGGAVEWVADRALALMVIAFVTLGLWLLIGGWL